MKIELSTRFWEQNEEEFKYKITNITWFIGTITITNIIIGIYINNAIIWVINILPTILAILTIITYPTYTRKENEKRNNKTTK